MARPSGTDAATTQVLAELRRCEVLLQAGREFRSVANIVAGEEIRGSWWSHPQSNLIYWVCQDLEAHPDVTEARLIAGKVTQLWRSVWPDVVALALARSPWQLASLSPAARALLDGVDEKDVQTDSLEWRSRDEKLGDVCRLLERRLLLRSQDVHTARGRHTKRLSSWERWWREHGTTGALPSPIAAQARIERLLGDAAPLLGWKPGSRASKALR